MKLTTILLLTASIIGYSSAYPASANPDDDAEVISDGSSPGYQPGLQPGYQPPSVPSFPQYPYVPSIPSYPTVPVYPSYHIPAYPTYTPNYFPFGWTYNVFDGFSNFFNQIRSTASNAWSRVPSVKPMINNYWPDVKSNGTTTSTVKVVGDHKFIINETVHVQQSDFGHVVFKVRTVDVKPVEPNDETTEGVEDNDTTISPDVDIDEPNTTQRPTENEDDDERSTIEDFGDIDGNRVGEADILDDANEISRDSLENFEREKAVEKDMKKQSLVIEKSEKIEFELPSEMISSEEIEGETMSPYIADKKGVDVEWAEIELEDSDEQKKTYYEVNNNENSSDEEVEHITYDLTDDIAINQMLADQGASYNPDAEVFDISQYQPESVAAAPKENIESSFDYSPYPHPTPDKRPSNIK
ncbi:uncharacterized protein LOC129567077 [Sitodiplosis mosellana]|uniref:uncharacterized protein LOC129567077 n=1 Tax=Sitodiplosis mosellana TaxID=263140 RepID=UPI0024446DEF|nr:uncharacterized protein LOC129567077 [Sitodiplosis mosellana]